MKRLQYNYNLKGCSKISNIPYNLIFTTKFNDSSILITIISCDYLNFSLANEYVGDVTIPYQVIKYNQNFLQADQPIRLQYTNKIKLIYSYSPKLSDIDKSHCVNDLCQSNIHNLLYLPQKNRGKIFLFPYAIKNVYTKTCNLPVKYHI